ncbi:MAG: CDP-alcohol phosphatidyltransferase family protein [Planctomycetota bacterium]
MKTIVPIPKLREICQDPVRENNDLAGALFGGRFSIFITAAMLRLGLSANVASRLMLLSGLAGSLTLLAPGWWRVLGIGLVTLAFVFDCVDGEMARYYKVDSFRWAAFDYVHHMTVKGLAFFCLGIGLFLEYGTPWTMAAGGIGSLSWLLLMTLRDLGMALFTKKIVLNDQRSENPAYQRLLKNMGQAGDRSSPEPPGEPQDVWGSDFRFGPWVVRTYLVSFDLAGPTLLLTSLLDLCIGPFSLAGITLSPTILMLYLYAVVLPLHLLDLLHGAMRRGELRKELYDLARRIDSFR